MLSLLAGISLPSLGRRRCHCRSPSRRPFRRQGGHPTDDPSKVAAFASERWPPSPRNQWPPSRRNHWPPSLGIRIQALRDESDEKQYWLSKTPAERLAADPLWLRPGYHPTSKSSYSYSKPIGLDTS